MILFNKGTTNVTDHKKIFAISKKKKKKKDYFMPGNPANKD